MTPLREGGSLPAVVEADNLGTYVLKFRAPRPRAAPPSSLTAHPSPTRLGC